MEQPLRSSFVGNAKFILGIVAGVVALATVSSKATTVGMAIANALGQALGLLALSAIVWLPIWMFVRSSGKYRNGYSVVLGMVSVLIFAVKMYSTIHLPMAAQLLTETRVAPAVEVSYRHKLWGNSDTSMMTAGNRVLSNIKLLDINRVAGDQNSALLTVRIMNRSGLAIEKIYIGFLRTAKRGSKGECSIIPEDYVRIMECQGNVAPGDDGLVSCFYDRSKEKTSMCLVGYETTHYSATELQRRMAL